MSYTAKQILIMRDAYESLGEMVSAFNKPVYSPTMTDAQVTTYMGKYLKKAMRDFEVKDENFDSAIDYDGKIATYITNRVEYYMLVDFRFMGSVMYKFSSSKDGFSVEKDVIYKNLNEMIKVFDDEYNKYVKGTYHHGIWTMTATTYDWSETE